MCVCVCVITIHVCRCSVLQLELDNAREDMKTMNEQILKVAKQKYELQLQLEAWQVSQYVKHRMSL